MTTKLIVLITGANKGIGFATAGAMARDGHTVLLGARDEGRGTAAAASLAEQGLDVRYVRLDVTDPATIAAAAELVDAEYGRLDVLVNNAVTTRDGGRPPGEMPVDDLREVYETNVFGVVAVTNAMLPLLRRSPSGYVGNVSSGLGTFAFLSDPDEGFARYATLLGYNSSKAALNAVTLIYAHALRDSGIRVNALSPGFCATDLNGHTGVLSAEEGGAHIARQFAEETTGVFLNENGGTYPW
ncbi:SDR family NAD(P)-dependent oxidoreductase [Actinomadura sp. NPDC048021]|uniref:SDR family NAD(P)-dependent oxidoreductase n=1 Tax=Actinomadura sp. NPDC048021 TaxID=3155385 RepID=UPI0034044A1F